MAQGNTGTPKLLGRKATSADVAVQAGVSKWTVTRAYIPGASISEDSRRRVMEAAEQLGYRPNLLARSLATKSTRQVAVLVDDFSNPYKLTMLELLSAGLQAKQMAMMLININSYLDHASAMVTADQRQVDATVLLGTDFRDETLREFSATPFGPPLFVLARKSTIDRIPSVTCDPITSMEEMVEHLSRRGYTRPGFMAGPRTLSTNLGRRRAFAAAWRKRGVPSVSEIAAGAYDWLAAVDALRSYLNSVQASERIDVLMCENDVLACGAIDVARTEFGLSIPDDLAIAGYDGSELSATPGFDLTTYEQPMKQMVDVIIGMVVGVVPFQSSILPGRLIVRSSA
jgi:LacI family transcriptional regulator